MRVTLRHLEIFAEVARQLSISKAAHALGVTQPAVSQQIAQLEKILGVNVIEIIGRKVFLTDHGQRILKQANLVARQVENLALLVDEQDDDLNGKLRLTVSEVMQGTAIKLLAPFYRDNPKIHLEITTVEGNDRLASLHQNMTDICLVTYVPVSSKFDIVPLMDIDLSIVVGRDHPLAAGNHKPSVREIARENLIINRSHTLTLKNLQHIISEHSEEARILEFNNIEMIKRAVVGGLGYAAIPTIIVEDELARGDLVKIDVKGFPVKHTIHMVALKGRELSRTAQAFKEFVLENMDEIK